MDGKQADRKTENNKTGILMKEAHIENYLFGRLQPQAVELEEAVLGALMTDKDVLPIVSSFLTPDVFYIDANQTVYRAILSLFQKSRPIDLLTVTDELNSIGELEEIGGSYYLSELTNRVASSANIEYHARIVLQKWMLRTMIKCGNWLVKSCYEDGNVFEVMDEFELMFSRVTQSVGGDARMIGDVIKCLIENAKAINDQGGKMIGQNLTGVDEFEEVHGGGMPGDLITVSGDSGAGKSSLFNNILCQSATLEIPIYAWSGEMTDEDQAARMLSAFTEIPSLGIKGGTFFKNEDMLKNVEHATELLKDKKVYLDYSQMGLTKLKSTIINKYRVDGVRVFLLDRLELLDLGSVNRDPDTAKANIMQTLRGVANQLKVTIIIAAQLRKEFEKRYKKIPEIQDIIGSAAIFQSSTKIFIIYRPEIYGFDTFEDGEPTKDMAEIYVKKNTHGKLGSKRVKFYKTTTIFGVDYMVGEKARPNGYFPSEIDAQFQPSNVITRPKHMNGEDVPF